MPLEPKYDEHKDTVCQCGMFYGPWTKSDFPSRIMFRQWINRLFFLTVILFRRRKYAVFWSYLLHLKCWTAAQCIPPSHGRIVCTYCTQEIVRRRRHLLIRQQKWDYGLAFFSTTALSRMLSLIAELLSFMVQYETNNRSTCFTCFSKTRIAASTRYGFCVIQYIEIFGEKYNRA